MTLMDSEVTGSGAAQATRELTGKTALVTGAARGIGAATAVVLAERGANVIAYDVAAPIPVNPQSMGTPEELAATVAAVEHAGAGAMAVTADVAMPGRSDRSTSSSRTPGWRSTRPSRT